MSLAKMKRKRKNFEELAKKFDNKKKSYNDDRFYYPERDKNGNSHTVIRFLPEHEDDPQPFVKVYSHNFQEAGGWFIDECRTTLGEDCPVCRMNSDYVEAHGGNFKAMADADIAVVRKHKRKEQFISHVQVISDKNNPELEGKVMLFKYGIKIFNMIQESISPEFDDETPCYPFDLWEGANFNLRIRKVDGNANYDKSSFDKSSALAETDKELEAIYNQVKSLFEFVDPEKFQSYEKQETRLNKVMGLTKRIKNSGKMAEDVALEEDIPDSVTKSTKSDKPAEPTKSDEPDDDKIMEFFNSIAE